MSVAEMMRQLKTREHEQNGDTEDRGSISESFMDTLCFRYEDMPAAGKHIYMRELQQNIKGSLSIPQYVHIHQGNSPVVRTEYAEIQDLGHHIEISIR